MDTTTQLNYALDCLFLIATSLLAFGFIFGLIMFQAGMVQAKNTIDTLIKNLVCFALAIIVYLLLGQSIMYGLDGEVSPYLPNFNIHWLEHSIMQRLIDSVQAHDHLPGMFLQIAIAAIPVIIVASATLERIRAWSLYLFAIVLVGFIYPIIGHWTWSGGFLAMLHFSDSAGAGVVHLTGAIAGATTLLFLGARSGRYDRHRLPLLASNLPLASFGILLSIIGGLGITIGTQNKIASFSQANTVAVITINTLAAIAAGIISATLFTRVKTGKSDLSFCLNGAVAGLVAISASPATPSIPWAMLIGFIASTSVVLVSDLLNRLRIDDPVGAIAVHGTSAIWGLLAACFSQDYFAKTAEFGEAWTITDQLVAQVIGIVAIITWVFVTSAVTLLLIRFAIKLRVNKETEQLGLDTSEPGMQSYPEFTQAIRN